MNLDGILRGFTLGPIFDEIFGPIVPCLVVLTVSALLIIVIWSLFDTCGRTR
jgi:hypothetical protein